MTKKTLEKYEPKCAKLFLNSRKNNRLFSAYLLYGPKNAPLKETAFFLSQSLQCEKDLLACGECDSCKRFLEGIRPDFLFIDGQDEMIKKGDIQELEKKFSLSAYEKGHSLCYVINKIDNMNNEAANALLKFLEEPKVGQVAFLTTNNLNKVLPTIRSRCLSLRIDPIEIKKLRKDIEELQIPISEKKKKAMMISPTESYILSKNFASLDEVKDALIKEPDILNGIQAGEAFLQDYCTSYKTACFTLLKETTILKENKCYNWLYLTVLDVFESVLLNDSDQDNPFSDIIHDLKKRTEEIRKGVEIIQEMLTYKNLNYNVTLSAARFLTALDTERKQK